MAGFSNAVLIAGSVGVSTGFEPQLTCCQEKGFLQNLPYGRKYLYRWWGCAGKSMWSFVDDPQIYSYTRKIAYSNILQK